MVQPGSEQQHRDAETDRARRPVHLACAVEQEDRGRNDERERREVELEGQTEEDGYEDDGATTRALEHREHAPEQRGGGDRKHALPPELAAIEHRPRGGGEECRRAECNEGAEPRPQDDVREDHRRNSEHADERSSSEWVVPQGQGHSRQVDEERWVVRPTLDLSPTVRKSPSSSRRARLTAVASSSLNSTRSRSRSRSQPRARRCRAWPGSPTVDVYPPVISAPQLTRPRPRIRPPRLQTILACGSRARQQQRALPLSPTANRLSEIIRGVVRRRLQTAFASELPRLPRVCGASGDRGRAQVHVPVSRRDGGPAHLVPSESPHVVARHAPAPTVPQAKPFTTGRDPPVSESRSTTTA